jgi:fructokinase
MVSFDPNVRPRLLGDVTDAREWIEALLGTVDLVKVSDEDLAWLYPGARPDDVAARWRDLGPAVVIVTLGAAGARGFAGGDPVVRPARHVQVADTVGAGDSYAAGLLHWLDGAQLTGTVASGELSDGELCSALDYAAAVASITCSRAGAVTTRAAEVDAVLGTP